MKPDDYSFWRSRHGLALIGFLTIGGLFLLAEHRAHALAALPFVLLALCPLLHFFGHGGHAGRGGQDSHGTHGAQAPSAGKRSGGTKGGRS